MTVDLGDVRLARAAEGLLGVFNTAGVLDPADVHVAARIGRLGGETDEEVLLAVALAVRAVRLGSVCVDLAAVSHTVLGEGEEIVDVSALPWPDPTRWLAACAASVVVADGPHEPGGRPLRLVDGLLYLARYWGEEELVRRSLTERAAAAPPDVDLARLRAGLERYFSAPGSERQRLAAAVSVLRRVTVLAGGPGTGKTTTVARLLALLHDQPGPPPRVALAAPTGKAAARLQEAVAAELPAELRSRTPDAATLHRLLGWRPGRRFRYGRSQRLPFDVVVVDETSMVSLTLMARLLEAVRPEARIVLVGDPDQLASVEAGAVLGDLARAPGQPEASLDTALEAAGVPGGLVGGSVINGVVTLRHVWRFGGAIAEFSRAVQAGDADTAVSLLRGGHPDLEFVESDDASGMRGDVVAAGRELTEAALRGDVATALAALERHRVLCAHRRGPYGVTRWSAEIERWLRAALPHAPTGPWYPGRPVLVTANDYDVGLFNGDTGVAVAVPEGLRVAFARGGVPTLHPPARLSEVATVHAMTVHRGQGSQFRRVTVVLPPAESPLLTRELLYTAVTRAAEFVRVVGTEEAVRTAVGRPVSRASGLRHRLASTQVT
ncbi:exodeoxyribonuclease V subunit alpha [Pseudonocardia cypriaca]|uniref:RecBCD enzyme subunit RecD n=1 Tax=Pseudonocardia cypriaca TaxID=882449 RepID=A0A543GBI1_9PSEU|nr:exodeoxyribonuclease V subunit alpha [Pseudonocardia cypriaca]TQM43429.1 DNA helicase/exodeoxyribonuclease V alpha subunit [Pseudonocardia cypriaca]